MARPEFPVQINGETYSAGVDVLNASAEGKPVVVGGPNGCDVVFMNGIKTPVRTHLTNHEESLLQE